MAVYFQQSTYCCNSLYLALCYGYLNSDYEDKKHRVYLKFADHPVRKMTISCCPFCGKKKMITIEDNTDRVFGSYFIGKLPDRKKPKTKKVG